MLIRFVLGLCSVSATSTELELKCVLHRPRLGLFLELLQVMGRSRMRAVVNR